MTYPNAYRTEMTGEFLHVVLEDVADNLFNPDPYYQQGGDMVRIGGIGYQIDITKPQGSRITDLTLAENRRKDRRGEKLYRRRLGQCQRRHRRPADLGCRGKIHRPERHRGSRRRKHQCQSGGNLKMIGRTRMMKVLSLALIGALAAGAALAEGKTHFVAIHVDENDPQVMNMALNNVVNVSKLLRKHR